MRSVFPHLFKIRNLAETNVKIIYMNHGEVQRPIAPYLRRLPSMKSFVYLSPNKASRFSITNNCSFFKIVINTLFRMTTRRSMLIQYRMWFRSVEELR